MVFNFITDRTQFVRIRSGISIVAPVVSGVPQETALGPLLFFILISDISNNVTSSFIVSFADDYLDITDVSDRNTLQDHQDYLNAVYGWATAQQYEI